MTTYVPKQLLDMILGLIGVSGRIGRYILIGKSATAGEGIFCELHPGVHPIPLDGITGYLCRDDYDEYPHVLEPLQISHKYDWFSRELEEAWHAPTLGTRGRPVDVAGHRKISQYCVANVDFITSRANENVIQEQARERADVDRYVATANSIRLRYHDIHRRRGDIVLYEWVLKVSRENLLYTHMFTFPHTIEYIDGYITAFLISSDLRFLVYKHLLENVTRPRCHFCGLTGHFMKDCRQYPTSLNGPNPHNRNFRQKQGRYNHNRKVGPYQRHPN